MSVDGADATRTMPFEPAVPLVDVGLRVSESGACWGINVICVCSVAPFKLALMVTTVFVATAPVGMLMELEKLPGATVVLDRHVHKGGVAT